MNTGTNIIMAWQFSYSSFKSPNWVGKHYSPCVASLKYNSIILFWNRFGIHVFIFRWKKDSNYSKILLQVTILVSPNSRRGALINKVSLLPNPIWQNIIPGFSALPGICKYVLNLGLGQITLMEELFDFFMKKRNHQNIRCLGAGEAKRRVVELREAIGIWRDMIECIGREWAICNYHLIFKMQASVMLYCNASFWAVQFYI